MTKTTKRNNKSNGNKEFAIFVIAIVAICTLIMCIPTNNTRCTYHMCDCDYSYNNHYVCDVHGHECME